MSDTTDTSTGTETTPVPTPDTGSSDSGSETTAAPDTTETTPDTSVPASDPSEGADDTTESNSPSDSTDETPVAPQVVNDDNGQHVVMPDGSVITTRSHTYPVSNAEQEVYELTHSGDQERYKFVPGDKEYNAYSDPKLPNSQVAKWVEQEIISFAGRILDDPNARVSPIWDSFNQIYQGELAEAIETGGGSGKVEA